MFDSLPERFIVRPDVMPFRSFLRVSQKQTRHVRGKSLFNVIRGRGSEHFEPAIVATHFQGFFQPGEVSADCICPARLAIVRYPLMY